MKYIFPLKKKITCAALSKAAGSKPNPFPPPPPPLFDEVTFEKSAMLLVSIFIPNYLKALRSSDALLVWIL
jgi:hypothetical protein